jgi:tetratricopeptide (TPR) repeat protein
MNARFSLNNQDNGMHQRRLTVPLAAAACHYSQGDLKDAQSFHPETIFSSPSIQREVSSQTRLEKDNRLRQIALEKAQEGKYSKTIEILTQLIEGNSGNANDYNNRGLAYFQNGQFDAAIADYNQAIHLNPHLAGAYNNRANYYAAQGRLEEAIEDYDKTIDLNPVHVRAWINQGITFRDMGEYEQAIDNFEFALRLGSLKGHVYAERGRTYHLVGDWNCAIADYRRALEHLDRSHSSSASAAARLRQQVENWLNELLSPFQS